MQKITVLFRIVLFSLILVLGTGVALIVGETRSLALADLSAVPVKVIAQSDDDQTLYIALDEGAKGIYRSSDSGRFWQIIGAGPAQPIETLDVDPGNKRLMYATTLSSSSQAEEKLWYSLDGGRTWQDSKLALPANLDDQGPTASALTAISHQPGVVYIGTAGQGLYRFDIERGVSDRIGGAYLGALYVQEIVASSDSSIYALTTEGVMAIKGKSVQKLESLPDAAVSLAIDPTNPKTLYAGTIGYGAFRSTDWGQSWQSINEGLGWQPGLILRVTAIAVDSTNPQHLALATAYGVGSRLIGTGIYESTNGGEVWHSLAESTTLVDQLTIKQGSIYAATNQGLIRYGEALAVASVDAWGEQLYALTHPSGVQLLILVLTLFFGGWVLVGRLAWLPERESASI